MYTRRQDRKNRPRTDASAGWREELRYAHAALPDGGEPRHALPAPGDRVRDRDGDEDDELLVVATHPDTPAEEYRIDALDGLTVDEVNEAYDARAPVVEAVYLEEIEHSTGEERDLDEVRAAVEAGALTAYSFPAPRLAPQDRDAARGGDGR